jgi:hypothetical protein
MVFLEPFMLSDAVLSGALPASCSKDKKSPAFQTGRASYESGMFHLHRR